MKIVSPAEVDAYVVADNGVVAAQVQFFAERWEYRHVPSGGAESIPGFDWVAAESQEDAVECAKSAMGAAERYLP